MKGIPHQKKECQQKSEEITRTFRVDEGIRIGDTPFPFQYEDKDDKYNQIEDAKTCFPEPCT